ncbi:fec operon regulator FecR [Pigmentiphaga humi]|uniref:Fec operon regulator FecR n=1 Tax=Pigmentiphaga humi TaxID=2478468 RepID=A0A3P4B1A5_9BURK|nr:FecR domain-containing protein [Pigmentiphaga humi]VCU70069.1 fec operon regulator FecR [Pigmentiphaga humi]
MPDHHSLSLDEAALDWFVRTRDGLDRAERQRLDAWLAADPRHGQAFARWERDWRGLDALPAADVARLRAQLAADRRAAVPPRRWLLRSGLALGVAALSAGGYLAWDRRYGRPLFTQAYATVRGQQTALRLPDGSEVTLDVATRLEVALYRRRREIRLEQGQAVFDVSRDPSRPFVVMAGRTRVAVLGTRFSVRHTPGFPGADTVRVTVDHGRVRVSGGVSGDAAVELTDGQQVSGDGGGLGAVADVGNGGFAPWRDGRVAFDATPLAAVLAEFERYADTGMIVRDPRVAALRVTGTFDPYRLDNFIRILPRVLPVQLRRGDGATEIVAAQK